MFSYSLDWYNSIPKPDWTPSEDTISMIWFILYPIILLSLLYVIWKHAKREIPSHVAWFFYINAVANLAFTPLLFGLQNLWLASADILLVLLTIVGEIIYSWRFSKVLSIVQIPYLVWVSIATVLQISILFLSLSS